LPLHKAVKAIPHIDAGGKTVEPKEPNGVKLETFVFDALPLSDKSVILETLREEEFAPVKNADGADSPEITRKMMTERAAKWLEQAGVEIPRKSDGKADCIIEMSPLFALDVEDVIAKKQSLPEIKAGESVYIG